MKTNHLSRAHMRPAIMLTLCAVALSGCYRSFRQESETAPLAYGERDNYYVEKALDVFTAHSTMTHADVLKQFYPLVVDFPDAVCVAMHHRPGYVDGGSTICFDNDTGELLTNFNLDLKPEYQHIPDKLKRPHYGDVTISGPGAPAG